MAKAEELDPHAASIPANVAGTYLNLRQWNDAKRAASRALALGPNNFTARWLLLVGCVNGDGRVDAARRVTGPLQPGVRSSNNMTRGNVTAIIGEITYLHILERDFAGALKQVGDAGGNDADRLTRLVARVSIRLLAGEKATGGDEAEEARTLLEERLRARPGDVVALTQLSWVYLALGRGSEAVRLAREAADFVSIDRDAFGGLPFAIGLAQVYAQVGNAGEAVNILRHLLSIHAGFVVSVNRLKLDPVWDPIRKDPEFQQLLSINEAIGRLPGYGQLRQHK